MTRPFHGLYQCSTCKSLSTAEPGFGRWIRLRSDLDSKEIGLVVNDIDYWVHRYKTDQYGRDVQLLMMVEVKTLGGEPSKTQMDTLHLVDQALNNRRSTPTKLNIKRQAYQGDPRLRKAWSYLSKKNVTLWSFGAYLLQFEQTSPEDSGWIKWGPRREKITEDQLVSLLRFDLDPDTLLPLDVRSHHRPPLREDEAMADLFAGDAA